MPCVPHIVVSVVVGWNRKAIMDWCVEGPKVGHYATMQQMTSYGGPSLGPEGPTHGRQRVYLGQMVKGLMVQPWSLGQPENIWHGMLRWSTHAPHHTSRLRRRLSVQAANRKALQYAALPTTHVFQPVAIETLGPLDPSACDFINQIGSRMSAITGDRRETAFLLQRLSMAIQRFNLVAFLGTFPSAIEDEA